MAKKIALKIRLYVLIKPRTHAYKNNDINLLGVDTIALNASVAA